MHWYSGEMVNNKSFAFWLEICGAGPYAAKWSLFIEAYRLQHPNFPWDANVEERIRHAACSYGDLLTIRGFIKLTNLCGFPLDMDKLPAVQCKEHASTSVASSSRMEITHMINCLIVEYHSDEFKTKIQPVLAWYVGNDDGQDRTNAWANEVVKNRGKPNRDLDERGKLALAADSARQTYVSFFQRCMATIEIGQLSRQMFAKVDFPGMAAIYDFIHYVKPLDYASYYIIMGGDPNAWQEPQDVYVFQ